MPVPARRRSPRSCCSRSSRTPSGTGRRCKAAVRRWRSSRFGPGTGYGSRCATTGQASPRGPPGTAAWGSPTREHASRSCMAPGGATASNWSMPRGIRAGSSRRSRFPTWIMHTVIVDDEAPARRRLRGVLQQIPSITRIDECASGREAVETLRRGTPDLVFLDLQMPDLDGFEVAAAASEEQAPAIVFVTAYDQHALRAFEVHAFDYLLKPFDDDRVVATVERAAQFLDWIRRGGAGAGARPSFGEVSVDFATHQVYRSDRPV